MNAYSVKLLFPKALIIHVLQEISFIMSIRMGCPRRSRLIFTTFKFQILRKQNIPAHPKQPNFQAFIIKNKYRLNKKYETKHNFETNLYRNCKK